MDEENKVVRVLYALKEFGVEVDIGALPLSPSIYHVRLFELKSGGRGEIAFAFDVEAWGALKICVRQVMRKIEEEFWELQNNGEENEEKIRGSLVRLEKMRYVLDIVEAVLDETDQVWHLERRSRKR